MELVTSTNIYFERRFEAPISMKECLLMCAKSGYKKLDFGFAELVLVSQRFKGEDWEEELLEYKELAKELGITFVQAHATIFDFCNPGEDYEEKKTLFERSILGARLLGASWIVVHPSTKIKDGKMDLDTHKENVKFFKKYADFAKKVGIGLAIENMWGKTKCGVPHYAVAPEELLHLVEEVQCENVRVCWDVEHGSIENLDQKKAIEMLKNYIVTTHISDEAGIDQIHILPFLGRIDWEKLLQIFADIGYEGIFNFEIQHYLPGVPRELILSAMKFSYEVGIYLVNRLEEMKVMEKNRAKE